MLSQDRIRRMFFPSITKSQLKYLFIKNISILKANHTLYKFVSFKHGSAPSLYELKSNQDNFNQSYCFRKTFKLIPSMNVNTIHVRNPPRFNSQSFNSCRLKILCAWLKELIPEGFPSTNHQHCLMAAHGTSLK